MNAEQAPRPKISWQVATGALATVGVMCWAVYGSITAMQDANAQRAADAIQAEQNAQREAVAISLDGKGKVFAGRNGHKIYRAEGGPRNRMVTSYIDNQTDELCVWDNATAQRKPIQNLLSNPEPVDVPYTFMPLVYKSPLDSFRCVSTTSLEEGGKARLEVIVDRQLLNQRAERPQPIN
jgi:phage tail protein X